MLEVSNGVDDDGPRAMPAANGGERYSGTSPSASPIFASGAEAQHGHKPYSLPARLERCGTPRWHFVTGSSTHEGADYPRRCSRWLIVLHALPAKLPTVTRGPQ